MAATYIWVSIIVVILAVLYWLMPDIAPKDLPFSVRVPTSRIHEPIIDRLRTIYRVGVIALTVSLLGVSALLVGTTRSTVVVVLMPLIAIAAFYAEFYLVRARLLSEKRRGGWYEGETEVAPGPPVSREEVKRAMASPFWLLPAVGVVVGTALVAGIQYGSMPASLPLHFGLNGQPDRWVTKTPLTVFLPVFTQLALTVFMTAVVWIVSFARWEVNPEMPETSIARQRTFVRVMTIFLYLFAALLNGTFLFVGLITWGVLSYTNNGILIAAMAIPLAGVVALVALALRVGQVGSRLAPMPGEHPAGVVVRNDDRFWKGGVIYYNPEDPAFLVPRRFGLGWTINMARPASWLFIAVIIVTIGVSLALSASAH